VLDTPVTPPDDVDGPLRRPPPPRTWRERVEGLADATGTSPVRIAVGGLLVLGVALLALWLLRPPGPPPEASLPFASTTISATPTSSTAIESTVVVHVAGAVAVPGVHELAPGSRVVDAIEAAGGLTPQADAARINLAAPLGDGERVYVLAIGEEAMPLVVGADPAGEEPGAVAGPVNLNTADAAKLDTLPGVGPATAAAIIEHRGDVGRFTSVDQLLDVPGIGEAKLEALRDLVTV
jgi:competence protein ComEA